MDAGWYVRTVRAALFAAVCVLLAAVGHTMMSCCAVPWWALVAGGAATGGAGWVLAGRERGPALIVTLVVGAQKMLHWGFSLAQSAAAPPAPGGMPDGPPEHGAGSAHTGGNHAHSLLMKMPMGHSAHTSPDTGTDMGHWLVSGMPSLGMSGAHLVAALLCGLWLGYGERVAYRLVRAAAGWLAAPLRLVLTRPALSRRPRRLVRRNRSHWAPYHLHLVHAITTRGPPLRTAVG
ncbi:hypothetical protein ACIQ9E_24145 [Streptomyces sp. NPDC094448]|uniref:hypothetical protein n=1 Tax=Streptomyces sp. NPDC094448 TaxID=3366063 RepID=UPI0037FB4698